MANYLKAGLVVVVAMGMSQEAEAQTPTTPVKNIVLVHGAWVDGSG